MYSRVTAKVSQRFIQLTLDAIFVNLWIINLHVKNYENISDIIYQTYR